MSGIAVLMHLAGSVGLLLWATRMVRTGVDRVWGNALRQYLRRTLDRPMLASVVGFALAIVLQSSTAVVMLAGSFAGSGLMTTFSGVVAARGAELGSAVVVRVLSFDLSVLSPICLIVGTTAFLSTERRGWRQSGRILVGIGLLLLSLELMRRASAPLRDSTLLPVLAGYLDSDQATAFLMMALLTYLLHSSIAAVLLLATLAGQGAIGPDLGVVMMLGVNLGSSFIAPALTRAAEPGYRVVPMANLLMRGVGSGLALIGFTTLRPEIGWLGGTPADQIVNAHILFNLVILLVGLPLSGLAVRISEATMAVLAPASGKTPAAEEELSALNEAALAQPSQALANATRELIRMCETVELMLDRVIDLYDRADARQFLDLEALDDKVDKRHATIRLYLSKIAERDMSAAEEQRCKDLLNACLKLEQVGDIIARDLLAQVDRKVRIGISLAPEDAQELHAFHASVMTNARLAFNLILTEDIDTARRLVLNKDNLRDIEKEVGQRHFARLRSDSALDVAASSIQLDSLRDLKQVNSLLTTIAYPVLEAHGQLRGTRLHEQAATG